MQDFELFEKLLGIEKPWSATDLELDVDKTKVKLKVEYPKKTKALCS